jgi:hypothetical protein
VFIRLVKKTAAGGVYLKRQLHGRPAHQKTTATDDTRVFVTLTFADFKIAYLPFEQLSPSYTTLELQELAAIEHDRWAGERLLNGWEWGSVKSDASR